ncbi:hypothetical protein EG829_01255 [bacterium]|nr:hypothetical protein [bacterium]
MDASTLKAGLTPLFLSVPPMFERSVGYGGDSRFVAFFWGTCDELCFCDDSLASGTIDSAGWLIFTAHPFVRRHLLSLDFGSADLPARHYLLLDRKERRFHVGERDAVEAFLEAYAHPVGKQAKPGGSKSTVTLDEFIAMAGNMEDLLSRELCPEEMMRRLTERQAVCSELKEWLERLS